MRDWFAGFGERADAVEETGARYAQLHRIRIVTIDAGDRVIHELARFLVRHRADLLEAGHQLRVAVGADERIVERTGYTSFEANFPVGHSVGRVTLQARARLVKRQLYTLGLALVGQHVRVAAALPVIH